MSTWSLRRPRGPESGSRAAHRDGGDSGQRLVQLRRQHVVDEHVFGNGECCRALLGRRRGRVRVDQVREVRVQGRRARRQRPELGVTRDRVSGVDAHGVVVAVGHLAVGRFPVGLGICARHPPRSIRPVALDHPYTSAPPPLPSPGFRSAADGGARHLNLGRRLLHPLAEPVLEVGAHRCVPSW